MNFLNGLIVIFLTTVPAGFYNLLFTAPKHHISTDIRAELPIEERILNELVQSKDMLRSKSGILAELKEEQLSLLPKAKKYKSLSKQIKKLEDDLGFLSKKIKLLNYMLSRARSLAFLEPKAGKKVLNNLNEQLQDLQKNKIPDYDKKSINLDDPYQNVTTDIYSSNLYPPCLLRSNDKDQLIANEFALFYEHTDPRLSDHFADKEFTNCYARFIRSGKNIFLELQFIYGSPKAKQFLGRIDASQPTRIRFINGEFIYLHFFSVDEGIISPDKMSTSYSFQYKLDGEDIRGLQKNEIDAIDLIWTSGSEQLDILRMDLLKNLLACIQEKS